MEKKLIVDSLDNTSQIIADTSQISEDKDALISSTSAIASLPISNDKNLADKIVTLKFLNPTWIQLRDSKNNVISVNLSDIEISERRKKWKKPDLKINQGILYKYVKSVSNASRGCVTDE